MDWRTLAAVTALLAVLATVLGTQNIWVLDKLFDHEKRIDRLEYGDN